MVGIASVGGTKSSMHIEQERSRGGGGQHAQDALRRAGVKKGAHGVARLLVPFAM